MRRSDLLAKKSTAYFFSGSLWPFAANASPKALRGPPPAGFWWYAPQAFPVCPAYAGNAVAGLGLTD